ncbi:MAG: alpha-galactosidase [Candidatus Latescibacterota bacterium]
MVDANAVQPEEMRDAHQWLEEFLAALHAEDHTAPASPGFSFTCGGQPSGALLWRWTVDEEEVSSELDGCMLRQLARTDSSTGLRVSVELTAYADFPVLEWVLRLANTGARDTPILHDIHSLDVLFPCSGPALLHHWRGDDCSPLSYQPATTALGPGTEQVFAPHGGRPTNGAWPYFSVEFPGEGRGAILAVGWPGQWSARFCRQDHGVRVTAGQEHTHFTLHPGEEVRTPLHVLLCYRGDPVRAQNLWRRWMLAHNLPRPYGRLPAPILSSCSGGLFPGLKCNEVDEKRFIDTFVREGLGLEWWWMDAGWYPCGPAWPQTGTWEVDRERFPRGIRAVSDHAHARGMRLILWFEPERVTPGTWLYEQHPEWLLGVDGQQKLLDLGNRQARAWLTDHVERILGEEGIDLYRQDHNFDPLPYWRANDAPDRQGITEIRHVEGYLAYWDELRRRRPGLLIDSCASGGRRNDLETLRRAVPLLRSDYQSGPDTDLGMAAANQGHTLGISSWIPYYGQGVYYNPREAAYNSRSYHSPAQGFCADARQPGVDWEGLRRIIAHWRRVAPLMLGDFYPLTPWSVDEALWAAWQFDCPEVGCGVVQAFRRRRSPFETARFPLCGLEAEADYLLEDLDAGGPACRMRGAELAEPGLPVTLPRRPDSRVLLYRRADREGESG